MNTFWRDLRYGFRMLWKRPGFTLSVVMALALGGIAIGLICGLAVMRVTPSLLFGVERQNL